MDAQIFQIDAQRIKRAALIPIIDPFAAMRSAVSFFSWYAEMMVTVHVAMVRAACGSK